MAKPWREVAASAAFQALTPLEREAARQQYFDGVVAPRVPANDIDAARVQFQLGTKADTGLVEPKPAPFDREQRDAENLGAWLRESLQQSPNQTPNAFLDKALAGGFSRDQAKTLWDRAQYRATGNERYAPPKPISKDEKADRADYTWGELGRDAAASGAAALTSTAQLSYELADLATRPIPGGTSLDDIIDLRGRFRGAQQFIREDLHTDNFRAKQKKLQGATKDGFFETVRTVVSDPLLLGDLMIQAAPYALGFAGLARGAFKLGLKKAAKKGLTGGAAKQYAQKRARNTLIGANMAVEGSAGSLQARQQVYGLDKATLAKSPVYQDYMGQGLSGKEALDKLADRASAIAAVVAAPIAGGASLLTAGMEARFFTGMVSKAGGVVPFALGLGGAIIKEAGEEAVQEGGSKFAANVGALLSGANTEQEVFEGVPGSAGIGATAGGTAGAGIGLLGQGASALQRRIDKKARNTESEAARADAALNNLYQRKELDDADSAALLKAGYVDTQDDGDLQMTDAGAARFRGMGGGQEDQQAYQGSPQVNAVIEKTLRGDAPTPEEVTILADAGMVKRKADGGFMVLPRMRRRASTIMQGQGSATEEAPKERAQPLPDAWQQTRAQFYANPDNVGLDHAEAVADALEQGRPVALNVLVDYPELIEARQEKGDDELPETQDAEAQEKEKQEEIEDAGGTGLPVADEAAGPRDEAQPARAEAAEAPSDADAAPGADIVDTRDTATHAVAGQQVQEIPVERLRLSDDVPQFKSGASATGEVEPLQGTFDRRGLAPIQVWRRANGEMEIISGRHRWQHARRNGETTIPAQVYDETDGFTREMAASLDAELNIRDGQGKVRDYVQFFQNPAFQGEDGRQEAESRGLLARATGKRAYAIASKGSPTLIAAHSADQISDQAAVEIAEAAPNDERLQALGMQGVQSGQSIAQVVNTMRAVEALGGGGASAQGDIFGFDDSAMQQARDMARVATTKQRDIRERIASVRGAAKRPDKARALGVDVADPEGVNRRIEELAAEAGRWDSWHTDPELVAQIRAELSGEPIAQSDEDEVDDAPPGPGLFDDGDAQPPTTQATEAAPSDAKPPEYGQGNKVFTQDAAAAARERLRKKLGRLNAGFDPQLLQDGTMLAGYHIEAGARSFAKFSKAMIDDLGEAVRPYLRYFYNAVRDFPGFDATDMDDRETVEAFSARSDTGSADEAQSEQDDRPAFDLDTDDPAQFTVMQAAYQLLSDDKALPQNRNELKRWLASLYRGIAPKDIDNAQLKRAQEQLEAGIAMHLRALYAEQAQVRIVPSEDGIKIQVPKSKAKGGEYYLNKALLEHTGDFVAIGSRMQAEVTDPEAAKRAIAAMLEKKPLYAPESYAGQAADYNQRFAPGASFSREGQDSEEQDLFGDSVDATARQQALEQERQRRDKKRSPGTDVPADIDGGLFANKSGELFARGAGQADTYSDAFAPTSTADDAALAPLSGALERAHGRSVALAAVRPRLSKQGAQARKLQAFVNNAFGRQIVWFRSADPLAPQGVTLADTRDRIFVNVDAALPLERVAGHELVHSLRQAAPEVYDALVAAMAGLVRGNSRYANNIRRIYEKDGLAVPDADTISEELVADLVGAFWAEPGFMRELAAHTEAGTFKRLVNQILAWLDRVAARLKGKPRGAFLDRHATDADAMRRAVLAALADFARQRAVVAKPGDHPLIKRMVAWHGSPHDFEQFSLQKIGTGEGAAAYGYGIYLASNRQVAEHYRNALSPARDVDGGWTNNAGESIRASEVAHDIIDEINHEFVNDDLWRNGKDHKLSSDAMLDLMGGVSRAQALKTAGDDRYQRFAVEYAYDNYSYTKPPAGKLYQVNIAPTQDEFLDWDKPLSEQTQAVQAKIDRALESPEMRGIIDNREAWERRLDTNLGALPRANVGRESTGSDLYRVLGKRLGSPRDASEYLHSIGISGIAYLDGASRNRPLKTIQREFLDELPEDASIDEVVGLIGTATFSPKNEAILKALDENDWLGFDFPAQAISAALSGDLTRYDPSPSLIQAVKDAQEGGSYNYVLFDDSLVQVDAKYQRAGQANDTAPTTRPVGQLYDETGAPYDPGTPVRLGALRLQGHPITREEADALENTGVVVRHTTRGPDTTGEQGLFAIIRKSPMVGGRQGQVEYPTRATPAQHALIDRIAARETVEFAPTGKGPKWDRSYQVIRPGSEPTPTTPQGGPLFSHSNQTKRDYERRIDALYRDNAQANRMGAKVLDRSDVLGLLGYPDIPVHLNESEVIEGRYNHHLTAEDWKKVPEWLESPAAVFDSDTVPGALVFLAPEPAANGAPIVITVKPNGRLGRMDVHLLTNAYDKDSGRMPVHKWINKGLTRFYDVRKSLSLGTTTGLQLPRVVHLAKGANKNIYGPKLLRNYRQQRDARASRSATPLRPADPAHLDRLQKALTKPLTLLNRRIPVEIVDASPAAYGYVADAEGVYHNGRIILFARNLPDATRAKQVLRHEAFGHFGMQQILGDKFRSTLTRVRQLINDNAEVAAIAQQVRERYDVGKPNGMDENSDTFIEEVIAAMAENKADIPVMRRLLGEVRAFLRRLGLYDKDITSDELYALIAQAGRFAYGKGRVPVVRAFDITPDMRGAAQAGQPLFSRPATQRFAAVEPTAFEPNDALARAQEITGLTFVRPAIQASTRLGENTPLAYDPDADAILYNVQYPPDNQKDAVFGMAEELLHAVDAKSAKKALSAGSQRLAPGGDIREEADAHFLAGGQYADFLFHPLTRTRRYTESEIRAELFARLGVLYLEDPQALQRRLPKAYEAYHAIFGLESTDEIAGEYVRRPVWQSAIGPQGAVQTGGQQGQGANIDRRYGKGHGNWRADPRLRALHQGTARAFEADPLGKAVQHSLLGTRRHDTRLIGRNADGTVGAAATVKNGEWLIVSNGGGDLLGYGIKRAKTRQRAEQIMAADGLTVAVDLPNQQDQAQADAPLNEIDIPAAGYFGEIGYWLQYQAQDKFNDLTRLKAKVEKSGEKVSDRSDVRLQERLFHGRSRHAMDVFDETHVEPLLDHLQKTGFGMDGLADYLPDLDADLAERYGHLSALDAYLYARHAPEANAKLAEINPGEGAMSGMSDEDAARLMAALEAKGEGKALLEAARRTDAMLAAQRELLVASGLEKQTTIDAWEAAYTHFMPLKGPPGGKDNSLLRRLIPRSGRGFDTRGKHSKRRLGRKSPARDILANVVAGQYATIRRAEKNAVGRSMLRFAQEHVNDALWTVNQPMMRRALDPVTGLVTMMPDPGHRNEDNVFIVRVNGVEHHIEFNENNDTAMRLVKQLKHMGEDQVGPILGLAHGLNRYLSLMNTSANPEFVLSNFSRDLQTAVINLNDTQAKKLKRRIIKDAINGKAMGAIWRYQRGERDGEWVQAFADFQADGAKTGWMEGYENLDSFAKGLKNRLDREKPGTWAFAKRSARNIYEFIDRYNSMAENAVRLSAYKHARENGVSRQRAAELAKTLTVDFNVKGNYGNSLNALYLFYNASMQGTARMLKAARSPAARRWMYGTVGFGIAQQLINAALAGDDEDGRNRYDKIPEYVKRRNLILMLPPNEFLADLDWVPDWMLGPNGDYLQFPMPYGYNALQYTGQKIGRAMTAAAGGLPGYDPMQEAVDIAIAFVNAFNPVGGSASLNQIISPTIFDPAIQWIENKNFAGIPLYPEAAPYGPPPPNYTLYFSGARAWSRGFTEMVNMASGGTEVRPGWINISPELLDHYSDFLTGGVGTFFAETADLPRKLFEVSQGHAVNAYEIPFLGKLYGTPRESDSRNLFYDRRSELRYLGQEYKLARENRNAARIGELRRQFPKETQMLGTWKRANDVLRRLNGVEDRINASDLPEKVKEKRLDAINKKQESVYQRANRLYDKRVVEAP